MTMVLVRNGDVEGMVQLMKNREPFDASAATITFFLMRPHLDAETLSNLYASHEQSSGAPGANWATGLIVLQMPRSKTSTLPLGGKVIGKLRVEVGASGEEVRTYWPQFTLRCEPEPI